MKLQSVSQTDSGGSDASSLSGAARKGATDFKLALDGAAPQGSGSSSGVVASESAPPLSRMILARSSANPSSARNAATAYAQQAKLAADGAPSRMSSFEKYKDDQLLRNPGGDNYYYDEKKVMPDSKDRSSFSGRIGKDLKDVYSNVKNVFKNLLFGSKILYRDENGAIEEGRQRGLVGSCCDFFKDLGSALSFGYWRPDGESAPQGPLKRLGFAFSKMKEAVAGDLITGVTGSLNHTAQSALLAGWNLVEVVPDATIGNLDLGRKLTTKIFDNGQVMVEYLTDVIPTGDAWFRVHASNLLKAKLPILYNLKMPERSQEDVRWQHVRNTPFRKTIETIGSLLADVAVAGLWREMNVPSERHKE